MGFSLLYLFSALHEVTCKECVLKLLRWACSSLLIANTTACFFNTPFTGSKIRIICHGINNWEHAWLLKNVQKHTRHTLTLNRKPGGMSALSDGAPPSTVPLTVAEKVSTTTAGRELWGGQRMETKDQRYKTEHLRKGVLLEKRNFTRIQWESDDSF